MKYLPIVFVLIVVLISGVFFAWKLSFIILPETYGGVHLVPDERDTIRLRTYILSVYSGLFSSLIFVFYLWLTKSKCNNILWVIWLVLIIPLLIDIGIKIKSMFISYSQTEVESYYLKTVATNVIHESAIHFTGWFIFYITFF